MYTGLIFHIFAKLVFVIFGYILHYFLGATLTPYEYGLVGTITTILDFEYLFLNDGVRQAVSSSISQNKYNIYNLFLKGMAFQALIVMVLCLINFCGANLFGIVLNDMRLTKYIRFATAIIPFNGFYFVILGTINGFCRFKAEAILCTIYPVLKLSAIPYILFVFEDSVLGTEMGYLTAVFGVFVVSVVGLWIYRKDFRSAHSEKINMSLFIKNSVNFSFFFMLVSILLSADTIILKAVEQDGARVGYYTGAVTFGKVSYYLLAAFYIVLLPVVSKQYEKGEMEKARNVIADMVLIITAFILPVSIIIAATGRNLLISFYNEEYGAAGFALKLLILNNFLVGMIVVFNMIISITKKKYFSSVLSLVMVLMQMPLCYFLAKCYSMNGVAAAGSICSSIALGLSTYMVIRLYGNFFNVRHVMSFAINILAYIVISKMVNIFDIDNFWIMVLFCGCSYGTVIIFMRLTRVIKFKELLKALKGGR